METLIASSYTLMAFLGHSTVEERCGSVPDRSGAKPLCLTEGGGIREDGGVSARPWHTLTFCLNFSFHSAPVSTRAPATGVRMSQLYSLFACHAVYSLSLSFSLSHPSQSKRVLSTNIKASISGTWPVRERRWRFPRAQVQESTN